MAASSERGLIELGLYKKGMLLVGLDEVGRGCIAGPVFAAAVSFDPVLLIHEAREHIRDSKTLSAKKRGELVPIIKSIPEITWSVAEASVAEIDALGIVCATHLAMRRCIEQLSRTPDHILIDGNTKIKDLDIPQTAVVKGDFWCFSIAAASILAKEARDQVMRTWNHTFPQYGFDAHVGYGTKKHCDALLQFGPCALHRRSFAPVANWLQ